MAYSIVTNVCEGAAACAPACPVACIHPGPDANAKGTVWYWIDSDVCIDCGVCLEVCPVQGAVLPYPSPDQQTPVALH
ncbi:MAG: 4Fe-4S dicluster domain-containing protein [Pseudanabaenaceae cyanobacterium]